MTEKKTQEVVSIQSLGGIARREAMSIEQRRESASRAAKARWGMGRIHRAPHIGTLTIGDAQIDCAVLEDGRRVLSQRAVLRALGREVGGSDRKKVASAGNDAGRLPPFLSAANLKPFISEDLRVRVTELILYKYGRKADVEFFSKTARVAHGLDATALPMLCDVWLKARTAGALTKQQEKTAAAAEVLMRGLAHVGIIALVDEATGYQEVRAKDALAKILEEFIAKELQPWVKTFPDDFYREMFRLRCLDFPKDSVSRPQYFGKLTNNIIYGRLAPGVLAELKSTVERGPDGRPKRKYFQKLTTNTGYPKLREHLGSVVTAMKLSSTWAEFMEKLDRIHPPYGKNYELPLDESSGGRGL